MLPEIVADENVDNSIIMSLRSAGYTVHSIAQDHAGITDPQVIEIAKEKKALLLTEDSDFGEWVFAHKVKGVGVIFLRYCIPELSGIIQAIRMVLLNYGDKLHVMFVVVTTKKIRTRLIDQTGGPVITMP